MSLPRQPGAHSLPRDGQEWLGTKIAEPTPRDYWLGGSLHYLLRRGGQLRFYQALKAWKKANPTSYGPFVSLCHRHFGKTTAWVIYCWERCLRKAGTQTLFIAPKHNQCDRNLRAPLQQLWREKPRDIVVKVNRAQRLYSIWNPVWPRGSPPSTFQYLGADYDDGNHIRGCGGKDVIAMDEVRDMPKLRDLIQDVIIWSFQKREDPLLGLISTPPKSLDHDLVRAGGYVEQAQVGGTFFLCRASENRDFSPRDEEEILKFCRGDRTSDFYAREAECQIIQDASAATIPEYGPLQSVIECASYERPKHFHPLIVADMGWEPDPTAILAGYVDYENQRLVIEKEAILRRSTTGQFAQAVEKLEMEVFGDRPVTHPVRRYADATPQQLDDFWREHKLRFQAAEKYDFPGALARLRTQVGEQRVRILPGASQLRYQCLTGLLDQKGKLERTESLGHQDAVAALIYMARMAPWTENPSPILVPQGENLYVPAGYVPAPEYEPSTTRAASPGRVLPSRKGYLLPKSMWS